ncbi:MAG: hypothetical protein COB36_11670 [Alphaproteobacteria bacterium]|nr:MAG: hypothetical protein COB36_11670 [Alphaproteobacteria bacterium]
MGKKIALWAAGFFGGGSFYGYLILVLMAGGLVWGFADHYYDKGKADCKAAQVQADKDAADIGDTLNVELEAINDEHEKTTNQIDKDYQIGLSYLDVENARKQGVRDGKALERAASIEAERLKTGSCLNAAYADDSRLLLDARSLQFDIFGDSPESNGAGKADTVPEIAGGETLSGTPQGGYIGPD